MRLAMSPQNNETLTIRSSVEIKAGHPKSTKMNAHCCVDVATLR